MGSWSNSIGQLSYENKKTIKAINCKLLQFFVAILTLIPEMSVRFMLKL